MSTQTPSLEIERKYLIALNRSKGDFVAILQELFPDVKAYKITQVYLTADVGERRVRKRVSAGKIEFFYTEKRPVTDVTRVEEERRITQEEYTELLEQADPALYSIEKFRYVFQFKGQTFELDMYNFSKDKAIIEIELPSEDTPVCLPPFIKVIKEVTCDKAYKNKSLAKTRCFA